VADGTIFEKRGVLAAALITHTFTAAADAMAQRYGYPHYRYAAIPHPISSLNAEQIKQRAIDVLPEILSILGIEEGAKDAAAAAL
jgi:hypothetical protein